MGIQLAGQGNDSLTRIIHVIYSLRGVFAKTHQYMGDGEFIDLVLINVKSLRGLVEAFPKTIN